MTSMQPDAQNGRDNMKGVELAQLFSSETEERLDALDALDPKTPGACFAVREVLLSDENAHVRAAAARFFERAGLHGRPVAPALIDALYDTHPSVRLGVCRALARSGVLTAAATSNASFVAKTKQDAVYILRRLALEEPIWWARRAAVLALARIDRQGAIPTLREVLDDPFWRVRHAAVRALIALSNKDLDEGTQKKIFAASSEDGLARSERAQGALHYLAKRVGSAAARSMLDAANDPFAASAQSPDATSASSHAGALADADPAVIAARLENGHEATAAELALYLGDPHEALRRGAADRLLALHEQGRAESVRAFLAASLWLEEPRIPHATASVVKLLDRLGEGAAELLDAAASSSAMLRDRPGLTMWALSFIAMNAAWDRLDFVVRVLETKDAPAVVRRAAVSAMANFLQTTEGREHEDVSRFVALLAAELEGTGGDPMGASPPNPDPDVRRLAVHALVQSQLPAALRAVLALPLAHGAPSERRLVVLAARIAGDHGVLRAAINDDDPETRALALATLLEEGNLDEDAIAAARASADPWIRGAVLSATAKSRLDVLDALRSDVDPSLKRSAFDIASGAGATGFSAARIAMNDPDPHLRTYAAELLARSRDDEDLVRVLRLSRDPHLAVRAAAANVLEAQDLEERLLRVRDAAAKDDVVVIHAAETWLGIRAEALIAEAKARGVEAAPVKKRRDKPPVHVANARPLGGKSGLTISPLVLSGAYEPSVASLFRALSAGCNAFFWEPRYRNLTAFLRAAKERGEEPLVIAGTYHATERAIRADVEAALRRLRRDALDVLLVFWVRSAARLEGEVPRVLEQLKREGLVRAVGFSTHDRALAESMLRDPYDVLMIRHSAAHPGAEESLFARAHDAGFGVLGFSATSYTRLMRLGAKEGAPSAVECYQYSLSQHGVSACVSAPRGGRELVMNLDVLETPALDPARIEAMRARGKAIRAESQDFNRFIRRFPTLPDGFYAPSRDRDQDITQALDADSLLDAELDAEVGLPHG